MIQLENFTAGYGQRILIENANATIGDGRLTALIGRNGSGKSTLLRAIAGLNRHYSGKVKLNGKDSGQMTAEELAKNLAFVSTERTRIPNLRCRDVVAIGRAPTPIGSDACTAKIWRLWTGLWQLWAWPISPIALWIR